MSLEMVLDRVGERKERKIKDSTNNKRGFAIDVSRILGLKNIVIYLRLC